MILGRKDRPIYSKSIQVYKNLVESIYDCNEVQSTICRKQHKCFSTKQGLSFRAGNMVMVKIKHGMCPCSGQYGIDCGNQYCGQRKSDCKDLKNKAFQFQNIKNCITLN